MYHYVALNGQKKLVEGTINGFSEKMVEESLYAAGFSSIISLKLEKPGFTLKSIANKFDSVSDEVLVDFTSELASLIKAGLNLINALKIIQGQISNNMLKEVISLIIYDVQNGKTFHEALNDHPKVFHVTYRGIVEASEKSGTLEQGLNEIVTDMKRKMVTKSKVKNSMMQPVIIGVVAIVVVLILMNVVLPPMLGVFKSLNANLPTNVKILMAVTDFFKANTFSIIAILLIIILTALISYRIPNVKNRYDEFLTKMPVVGRLVVWNNTANIFRTLATLVKAGIILPESISSATLAINNNYLKHTLKKVKADIVQGKLMSESIKNYAVFPKMVSELIAVGEKTGHIEESFSTLSDYYYSKVERKLFQFNALLEPALMLLMGGFVGFLAITIIGTIYSLPGAAGF